MIARLPLLLICAAASTLGQPLPAEEAQTTRESASGIEWRYDAEGLLRGAAVNRGASEMKFTIPAGLVCKTKSGAAVITLQDATISVPAGSAADLEVPAAVLSSAGGTASGACTSTTQRDARIEPLLTFLKEKPDVPRATSQLVTLALTENVTLAGWEAFLQAQRAPVKKAALTPAQIVQAIDALGILRTIAPERAFALAVDQELKLRALRNPWCRAKAMQLYGLALPELAPAQAPDLGQLLHTKANDNCPVCRLRSGPPNRAGDL